MASVPLPGKAYTASQAGQRLVVGTSGRHVVIFNVRRYVSLLRGSSCQVLARERQSP